MPAGIAFNVGRQFGNVMSIVPVVINTKETTLADGDGDLRTTFAFIGYGIRYPAKPGAYAAVSVGAEFSRHIRRQRDPLRRPWGEHAGDQGWAAEFGAGWLIPMNRTVSLDLSANLRLRRYDETARRNITTSAAFFRGIGLVARH